MLNYHKRAISFFSFLISILLFLCIHFIMVQYKEALNSRKQINNQFILKTSQINLFENSLLNKKIPITLQEINTKQNRSKQWSIKINKIELEAPILETTSLQILKKAVGHFEQTSNWNGNVCLAAHNRGYTYNFFERIIELEKGDEIIYITKEGKREYIVQKKYLIKETDFTPLEESKENKITLITCAKNKPDNRVCIEAVQKKEKGEI